MANNVHIVRLLIVFSFLFISNISFPLQAQFVEPKFDKLPAVIISNCVLQDSYGLLRVVSANGGLYLFDLVSERFISSDNIPIHTDENSQSVTTKDFYSDSLNINAEDWSTRSGYWDFSGKVIKAQGFIGYNKAYYNHRVFTDFIYEVKLCKASEDGTFGLLFRYDEKNNEGYVLYFWPHGGCSFDLIKGGQTRIRTIEVSQPMHQIVGTDVWNTVKIVAHGSRFKIYLNGYLLDTIFDSQYSSGRVGLFIAGDPRQKALFEVTTIRVP